MYLWRKFLFSDILVCGKFKELVTLLHSAGLFDTLMAFPLKQFVQKQVKPVKIGYVNHCLWACADTPS